MHIFLIVLAILIAVAAIVTVILLIGARKAFGIAILNPLAGKVIPIIEPNDSEIIKQKKTWADRQVTEEVYITSADGLKLCGFIVRAGKPTDRAVLCFHGYTCTGKREYAAFMQFYIQNGYDMLIVDQRAHGKSEGKFISYGYLERDDCKRWVDFAAEKFGENYKFFLHGVSMGTGTICMASVLPLKNVYAMVADCGYTCVRDEFLHVLKTKIHLPMFPIVNFVELMCKSKAKWRFDDVNVTAALSQTNIPIIFFHGDKDSLVPMEMSQINYRACHSKKEIYIISGADHAESYDYNIPLYEEKVLAFFESAIGK